MNDEATSLIHAYLDGELTDAERRALGNWLRQSPSNVDRFVSECRLHSELLDARGGESAAVEPPDQPGAVRRQPFFIDNSPTSVPFAPVVIQASPDLHHTFTSVGGFVFSYAAAAVIVTIGMLIGWACHVPVYQQVAVRAKRPAALPLHPDPEIVFVGRVTGLDGCHWADPKTGTINYAYVPLGRKFALASGLMEITYDTGAKIILQGPCTYEVESKTGGCLLLGRLTARVEKRGEGRGERGKGPHSLHNTQQSAIDNPSRVSFLPASFFSVRTPTAIVTDLGTEFGVKVSKTGITETQVFLGKVKIEGKGTALSVVGRTLLAGQAARLEPNKGLVVISEPKGENFVRKMPTPKPSSLELIAQLDYSDTWSANSPTRAGSYLLLTTPESLRVENCYGNPPRSWVFSMPTAMTTWPYDNPPVTWPGFQVQGSRSGFTETGFGGTCYFGFEYGLRDDFIVQFDAVQTQDRINITVGDKPATIDGDRSLSVFFRAAGASHPEIGVYTPSKGEVDAGIRSGIPTIIQWHNYAVRFNLREKRLTVWVDRNVRGVIDLARIIQGMEGGGNRTWANLSWTSRCVTVGGALEKGDGRVWTDNVRVGAPRRPAAVTTKPEKAKDNAGAPR